MILDETFWTERYLNQETGWDIGTVSTPIKIFVDSLSDYNLKILIPGAGNGYEAEYLFRLGFKDVTVLDWAEPPLLAIAKRLPDFPISQLVHQNFFEHVGHYDLIIEQTFFCALDPKLRYAYATKMVELLNTNGRLCGLLFDDPMNLTHPPFGGSMQEYRTYFEPLFYLEEFEKCHNSIPPRLGKEMWMTLRKRERF
ncbi:MAG: TPMT family class I SAM-dependent methyltransferase [Flavobacteriales bacterium]|nr:TPMT family class I SAM-dependent methyltransferase [Flavobacteriales bacterium]